MPNREWNQKQKHEKQPDDKMIYRKEVVSHLPNDFAWSGRDTSRPRQIVDIQYNTTIMGGREVSRPYRVFRRETASGFYPFGVAKRLFFMFFVSVPPVFIHRTVSTVSL